VVREDPQAVIKDLFASRTCVFLKIDRQLTCPRFQPDGIEQDTRYVETFLYAIGDGVCSTSQTSDCQRNEGLHSHSLLCWTTWKHLHLACCTSEFASVQGVRKTVCIVGKHLCSSDQFQEFFMTLSAPSTRHISSFRWLTRSARHSHEYPLSVPLLQLLRSCSLLSPHLKADSFNVTHLTS